MYAFVARYADPAGATSPRKFLYLDLYAGLLDAASVSCRNVGNDALPACVAAGMSKLVIPDLEAKIQLVLALHDKVDAYEYTESLAPILEGMVNESGGAFYAGAVLQLAANKLGSSNQLVEDKASRNSYKLVDNT